MPEHLCSKRHDAVICCSSRLARAVGGHLGTTLMVLSAAEMADPPRPPSPSQQPRHWLEPAPPSQHPPRRPPPPSSAPSPPSRPTQRRTRPDPRLLARTLSRGCAPFRPFPRPSPASLFAT
ncbi:hypothetical protein I4F81_001693 [Pyropia yezoensis]|uniref:Uncharacterized protein n=1 Tax=Pyropia yezoensis TaxID=2788 RepID=A0ACC3BMA5_PYRYE|nr:hypothetical protein I4F81_001693 [Neopyropia yezoensis]